MVSVPVLWVWAAHRHHPLARPVLVAIVVSIAAAGMKAVNPELLRPVALAPTSAYHLAQIAGMVMLYMAVNGSQGRDLAPAAAARGYAVA
jgi:hypothetical protein